MQIQTAKARFAVEFIDLEQAAGVAGVKWEPYQIEYLNNQSLFSIDVKGRQIAWSFTSALDAVVDGILNPDTPHNFVSINLVEAKEKIRYAKAIIEAIDKPARPELLRSSQTEIEFVNRSRFISFPCRPPRGKARARVYLDEAAHYQRGLDREIYAGALPSITQGGYMRIGSSPCGADGLFWEIFTERLRPFPDFRRTNIPWWMVNFLCVNPVAARAEAPDMATEDRVNKFGTETLKSIFRNMFLEDFQQEYECSWTDESISYISWDVIKRNQSADHKWWHAKSVDTAIDLIVEVGKAIERKEIEPVLYGGIDVGRKKDLTEMMLLGYNTTKQMPLRFSVSLDRVKFDDQEDCFTQIIQKLPVARCLVDQNGIGMQLAENLSRKTGKASGVDFTNPTKELWAVEARLQAERGMTPLPLDREIAYQIHSIRKTKTSGNLNRYDTEGNEKHHADKFWAWALALSAATTGRVEVVENPFYK